MINRRNLLQMLVATAVGGGTFVPDSLAASASSKSRRLPWRNWSGCQQCTPLARIAPESIQELQTLLSTATGTIRPVGAGHSFAPLVPTDGTIVSMSRLTGMVGHDSDKKQATFRAGSRLGEMGLPLDRIGQALINMPDIEQQALAGCLATATHGTGTGIGAMPTFVSALQLVDARGNLIDCDQDNNSEVFEAAKVSLGALGVLTQVTLQNVAPYRLHREAVWHEIEEILEIADDLADRHRNFEFYYIPFTGMGFTDVHDLTADTIGTTEKLDGNDAARDLKTARDWLQGWPRLRELVVGSYLKTLDDEVTVERSWKNYTSERNVRFNEMEYHLPREHGLQALREVRAALESQHHEVFFPIEVRYVKGDDIWLSPFYQRDTCSIAVHRYFDEDFTPYFKTIEPIFRKYHGRPHWGKLNTLTGKELAGLYPRWDDFAAVRRELDPEGRFLNPYLQQLFA
jgi:FAD-linked oxidoreductase